MLQTQHTICVVILFLMSWLVLPESLEKSHGLVDGGRGFHGICKLFLPWLCALARCQTGLDEHNYSWRKCIHCSKSVLHRLPARQKRHRCLHATAMLAYVFVFLDYAQHVSTPLRILATAFPVSGLSTTGGRLKGGQSHQLPTGSIWVCLF